LIEKENQELSSSDPTSPKQHSTHLHSHSKLSTAERRSMEISISDFMSTSGKRNGSNWEHLKLHLAIGRRNASNPATSLYVFPLSPVYPRGSDLVSRMWPIRLSANKFTSIR